MESFTARFAKANSASKNDIVNFVTKADFDNELKILNKIVTSNQAKHVLVEYELNELSKNGKAILTKGLTKYLIKWYS